MTLTTYLLTLSIGALFGASLMLLAVARAESWRAQQLQQAAEKLQRLRASWTAQWLKEHDRAVKAESQLETIKAGWARGGKATHQQHRAAVLAKAAEMRAAIQNSTVVRLDKAA
jgi:hypothetical protein